MAKLDFCAKQQLIKDLNQDNRVPPTLKGRMDELPTLNTPTLEQRRSRTLSDQRHKQQQHRSISAKSTQQQIQHQSRRAVFTKKSDARDYSRRNT